MPDLVGVAIGAALGFGARIVEQARERRRRRRAIATVLLDELRWIELTMRQLHGEQNAARRGGSPIGSTLLRVRNSDDLFLFSPTTISHLLNIAGTLVAIEDVTAAFQSKKLDVSAHRLVSANAGFICERIPGVKDDLVREGGTPPPPEPLSIAYDGEVKALPPLAFPEWDMSQVGRSSTGSSS